MVKCTELIEAKVALAKAEMQLEWLNKLKDHSKPEPEVMAPLFEALAKAQAEFESVTATSRVTFKNVDFKFAPSIRHPSGCTSSTQ